MSLSDIKSTREYMEDQDSNLNLIINSAPVAMIILDNNRKISQVNDAALVIMEKKREAVLGKSMGESFDCIGSKMEDVECGTSSICEFCELKIASDVAFHSDKYTSDIEISKVLVKHGKEQDYWFKAGVTPVSIKGKKAVVISIMDITSNKNKEIAAVKSRDFCMNVIDHLPDPVWTTNLNMECDYANKGLMDFTGVSEKGILGEEWNANIHEEDLEKCNLIYSEAFERRESFKMSIRVRRYDGQFRWCIVRGTPYYDLDGKFAGYVGTQYDQTEKMLAKEGLVRYKLLTQHAKDIILFVDTNGKIVEANEAAVKTYGYRREELMNLTVFDLRKDYDIVISQLYKAAENGVTFEAVHYRKDGTSFLVEISSQSIVIDGKKILLSIIQDITERKEAEKEVMESQQRYYSLFMNMNDGIAYHKLILDEKENPIDFEYIQVNSAHERYFGHSKEELVGKRFTDIFPHLKESLDLNHFCKVALTGKSEYTQEFFSSVSSRWYSVTSYSPEKYHFTTIFTDIHDRKNAELELIKAKEQAEAANRAKSEFLANMSHEIRTPLNGMLGMIDLTMMTEINREQRENLSTAKTCADSLLNIINDILDFSKLEAGKLSIQHTDFDIKELIDETLKLHAIKALDKDLELNYQLSSSIPQYLKGDLHRLKQILNNLITNAIKFTDNGEVHVAVKKNSTEKDFVELVFIVTDTGMGIDEDEKAKLFKSFSQLDNTITKKHGGTGLGLVISKQLVEMMGGRIWIESEKGRGSKFYFTVKFEIGQESQLVAKGIYKTSKKSISPLRILLAEDDEINQKVFKKMLSEQGHTIEIAKNGHEAVEMYLVSIYDVILMDIQMPILDGIDATKMIRTIEKDIDYHTPIIALTAFALQGDRERFIDMGMDDYIPKPVKMEELFDKLEKVSIQVRAHNNVEKMCFNEAGEIEFIDNNKLVINDEVINKVKLISNSIEALGQAILAKDIKQIEKLSSLIKKLSDSINAYELKSSAFRIELAARRGNVEEIFIQAEQIKNDFDILQKTVTR
jgi:PAS domain S-box-containing protein